MRVVAKYPNHANELRDVALVAAARGGAAHRPDVLALAAYAAALNSPFAAASPLPPPFAAAYVAAAAAADPDLRLEIRFDASALPRLGARKLADLPLWSESLPAWWHWESLKAALPSDEGWDVWIEWYEERLRGGSRGEAYRARLRQRAAGCLGQGARGGERLDQGPSGAGFGRPEPAGPPQAVAQADVSGRRRSPFREPPWRASAGLSFPICRITSPSAATGAKRCSSATTTTRSIAICCMRPAGAKGSRYGPIA